MILLTVVLFIIYTEPNVEEPRVHVQKMDNIEECLTAAQEFTRKAAGDSHKGIFRVGCAFSQAPGKDS